MVVPRQGHQQVVLKCQPRSFRRHEIVEQRPSEAGRELDVAQSRHPDVGIGLAEDLADRRRCLGPKQVLEQRRCVGDDDPQLVSLAARSSRIRSAAGRPSLTVALASIRSNTSSAGGLATSRSRMSWTYPVNVWPRRAARLTSSRCRRFGTFLTWIMIDMR